MADAESTFNPKNPNNFNVEAQFLLIPGFLILAIVGMYKHLVVFLLLSLLK